jgi:hypothetical protein
MSTIKTIEEATPSAQTVAAAKPSAGDLIEFLKIERENWEAGQLTQSNEALYGLLAKCLRLYELMSQGDADGERLRTELADYLKVAKLKFSGETHTVVKIVRAVFSTDRKRASALGQALQVALKAKITHDGLVEYIRNAGGIEKLRLGSTSSNRESTDTKASNVWSVLKDTTLGIASGEALKKDTDLAKVNTRVVLLATQQANGEFSIHAVLRSETAVNAAYAAYKISTVAANNNDAAATIVEHQSTMDELRKQAAAAALAA